jgi:hypothetical protein
MNTIKLNTNILESDSFLFSAHHGAQPAYPGQYEAPDHVTVVEVGTRDLGVVGTSDGGTRHQYSGHYRFSGVRPGDVLRHYPWTREYRVRGTKRGLLVEIVEVSA